MAINNALIEFTNAKTRAADSGKPLSTFTLLKYLLGSRQAIQRIAESQAGIWVGLLFVLSAGFAREYDGADLLHEPWHLALPLVASLGTSLVLYGLVYLAARNRGVEELTFWEGYRTLLTFYWWTAPLAWLYAIPVERFMSPGNAAAANLWFLAAVSVWRVLLITRALAVWLNASVIGMFFIVMFFADSVAVLLAFLSPKPIFNIMGGVRLSEPDRVVLDTMFMIMFFGGMSWVLWLVAAGVVIGKKTPPWRLATSSNAERRVSKHLWAAAMLLLAVGVGILPIAQQEQRHRWQVEQLLYSGDLDAAVEYTSDRSREHFPPVWDLPPRLGYGEDSPRVLDVIDAIERHEPSPWFLDIYVEKLSQDPRSTFWSAVPHADDADHADFDRALEAFKEHVPVKSLDHHDRAELEAITSDDRFDLSARNALRDYLGLPNVASDESKPTEE